jgi:hypothetical protein
MPNGKQEKQANRRKKEQGKQLTRREVLKTLGAATILTPAVSLLWQGGVQASQQVAVDKLQISKVIDRALTDPEFRKAVKASPVETLAKAGVKLPPAAAEALTKAMKQDPNVLRKAVLGEASPLLTDYYVTEDSVEIYVLVISAVVIGVLVIDGVQP